MMPKWIANALIMCFLGCASAQAQTNLEDIDVDEYAQRVRLRTRNIERIAKKLTAPYKDNDSLKARAIFAWIAHNIAYDCKELKRREEGRPPNLKRQMPKVVLRRRKAVCGGYSALYEAIARKSGLTCEVITGIGKNEPEDIGNRKLKSNHAWNAIKIGKEWRLIDATWGSGTVEHKRIWTRRGKRYKYTFAFDYDDAYFLAKPEQFIVNHFPDKESWQLLDKPVARDTFIFFPIPYRVFFRNNFFFEGKSSYGIIDILEDTEQKLAYRTTLTERDDAGKAKFETIRGSSSDFQTNTRLLQANGKLTVHYEALEKGGYYVYFFVGFRPLLAYRVSVGQWTAPGRLDRKAGR